MKTFATAVMAPLFAVALAAPSAAQAQTTPAQTSQPRDTAGQNTATTIVGCLYREAQVPGRSPNVAEKVGVLEDYILVGASGSSAGATSTTCTPGTTGASGAATTTAAGRMFKVEGIDDERLKAMVGKRVEVSGRIDPDVEGRRDKSMGPDQINVAEFEAQSIKEVSGSCPATPAPGQ
jgi:hypothetical protein